LHIFVVISIPVVYYPRMDKHLNIGEQYGLWTIVGGNWSRPICKCACGTEKEVGGFDLRSGKSKGCGCARKELIAKVGKANRRHGYADSPTQRSWVEMRRRCYASHRKEYQNYGGRGIEVCERWRDSFDNFLADMGERPSGYTLERCDNNGNYCPENCCWIPRREQERNKRTNSVHEFNGRRMTVVEASETFGVKAGTIYQRLRRGWTANECIR
jgi:hypothetical protein